MSVIGNENFNIKQLSLICEKLLFYTIIISLTVIEIDQPSYFAHSLKKIFRKQTYFFRILNSHINRIYRLQFISDIYKRRDFR